MSNLAFLSEVKYKLCISMRSHQIFSSIGESYMEKKKIKACPNVCYLHCATVQAHWNILATI